MFKLFAMSAMISMASYGAAYFRLEQPRYSLPKILRMCLSGLPISYPTFFKYSAVNASASWANLYGFPAVASSLTSVFKLLFCKAFIEIIHTAVFFFDRQKLVDVYPNKCFGLFF